MKIGLSRFNYYLIQIQLLLSKAASQKNPALWLYQHNLRTPLFMIEALAKMHIEFHNKKKFTKLKEQFKILEDTLGAIDYYDSFAKEFATNKKIPKEITNYLQAQTREKIQSLNEILTEKQWLGADNIRITKIQTKLSKANWLKPDEEVKAIEELYGESIYEISEFVQQTGFHFDNIEKDVHELRRKLRWLSIYAQALKGTIQLSKNKPASKHLTKYLTKEILTSPFNQLPDAGALKYFLILDQNYFYSLSWMVAELGKLKDSGLRIVAIREALQQTSTISESAALKKAYEYLGSKQPKLEDLLTNAEKITKLFSTEHNLEHLVMGVSKIK